MEKEILLKVQENQLKNWEILLKKEVFEELKKIILKSNESEEVKANFQKIKRGTEIEMILYNEVFQMFSK